MHDVQESRIRGLSPTWWVVLAVVGIAAAAWFLEPHPAPPAAKAPAPAAPAAPRVQSGVVLLPGETLVAPPEPVDAPPAEAPKPATKKHKAPSTPRYVGKPAPAPSPPRHYSRAEPRVCASCGRVVGMRIGDDDWQVRVLYDDGSRETLRFRDRPPVEVGDDVRLEDGVLRNARR